jgi:Tfp pilus assembly protein FimT
MKNPAKLCLAAFSLVELLTVMGILALLAGAGTAVFTDMRSTGISGSTAQVGGALSMARDQAVAANRRVRFVIVTADSQNPQDWKLRKYGMLQQKGLDPTANDWELVGPLSQLPNGVYFGKNEKDGSSVGSQMLERKANTTLQGKPVAYSYIEFLPNGAANDVSGSNIFSIAGRASADHEVINSSNVARVGVAQHTGRVRIERP